MSKRNKMPYILFGITEADYKSWCKKKKLPHYKISTKKEFFKLINDDKIIINNNKIIDTTKGGN